MPFVLSGYIAAYYVKIGSIIFCIQVGKFNCNELLGVACQTPGVFGDVTCCQHISRFMYYKSGSYGLALFTRAETDLYDTGANDLNGIWQCVHAHYPNPNLEIRAVGTQRAQEKTPAPA